MKKSSNKSKAIKLRLSEGLYDDLHEITNNMSDFVRQAVEEKIEAMNYTTNSSANALRIKEIDLIIQNKKAEIDIYKQKIEREENEISELESEKNRLEKEDQKQEIDNKEKIDRLLKNPNFTDEMDENIKLILRKKYLHIETSLAKSFNKRANQSRIELSEYKEVLKEFFKDNYYVGTVVRLSTDKTITLNQQDMDYVEHRISE